MDCCGLMWARFRAYTTFRSDYAHSEVILRVCRSVDDGWLPEKYRTARATGPRSAPQCTVPPSFESIVLGCIFGWAQVGRQCASILTAQSGDIDNKAIRRAMRERAKDATCLPIEFAELLT